MTTATQQASRVDRLDEGDWLNRLLDDIQREVARQPSPTAIERIRSRLVAQMDTTTRAAA